MATPYNLNNDTYAFKNKVQANFDYLSDGFDGILDGTETHTAIEISGGQFRGKTSGGTVELGGGVYFVNTTLEVGTYTTILTHRRGNEKPTQLLVDLQVATYNTNAGVASSQTAGWDTLSFVNLTTTVNHVWSGATATFRWWGANSSTYYLQGAASTYETGIIGMAVVKG